MRNVLKKKEAKKQERAVKKREKGNATSQLPPQILPPHKKTKKLKGEEVEVGVMWVGGLGGGGGSRATTLLICIFR